MSSTARADADGESIDMRDGAPPAASPQPPSQTSADGPSSSERPVGLWDVLGLLAPMLGMLVVTDGMARIFPQWMYRPGLLFWLIALTGIVTLSLTAVAIKRERPALSSIPLRLTNVWRNPPGDWPAFVLGFASSLPLLGLYTPAPYADSDSVRIIAAVRHVQGGNVDFLTEIQDSFGPHLLLGPVAAIGGSAALRLFTIASMQLLVGLIAWLARRISGSMLAAAVAPFGLLTIAPFAARVHYLPMYPAMLAFGSLGTWLAYRVIVQKAGWSHVLGAGLCLVLAYEAQAVGQLFLAAPLVLLIGATELRRSLVSVAKTYGAVTLFLLPRFLVNIQDGGLSHMRSNRTDYWTTKGYLGRIQTDFWAYPGLGESYPTYLSEYPGRLVTSLGDHGWILVPLAGIGLLAMRARSRWLPLALGGLVVAAMTVKTIQPYDRYFSPLWPGLVLLTAVIATRFLTNRHRTAQAFGALIVAAILLGSFATFRATANHGRNLVGRREASRIDEIVAVMDNDKGVIGSRSHTVLASGQDIPTYGGQFLTEDEFATYLMWPSDEEVMELMRRHDVGWVLVRRETHLETNYHNVWLAPNHGREARHVYMVATSPHFCRAASAGSVVLYKLGSC